MSDRYLEEIERERSDKKDEADFLNKEAKETRLIYMACAMVIVVLAFDVWWGWGAVSFAALWAMEEIFE